MEESLPGNPEVLRLAMEVISVPTTRSVASGFWWRSLQPAAMFRAGDCFGLRYGAINV